MRLTWKIAATIAVTICLVLGLDAYLRVDRQIKLFEADILRDHVSMGGATAAAMTEAWISHGESLALELIERIEKKTRRVKVSWIPWKRGTDLRLAAKEDLDSEFIQQLETGQYASLKTTSNLVQNERYLNTYFPVKPNGVITGVIEISESLKAQKRFVYTTVVRSLVTTLIMIVVCVAATFFLGLVLVGRPVKKLVDQARSIGKGDFSTRLNFKYKDEISDLAKEMNTMADRLDKAMMQIESETTARLETLAQLRHADRLKTVGQLTSGVVHEIGTPLTVISGRAKMVATGEAQGEEAKECARIVVQQTERVTKTIRQILDFARRGEQAKTREDIGQIASEMVKLLAPVAVKRGLYLRYEKDESTDYSVLVDRSQIQQVLANLIVNGIQAAKAAGSVEVKLEKRTIASPRERESENRDYFALSVNDDGDGIPDDVRARIFEPFFTTKTSGAGTGLGLAISREIVKEHQGWIEVDSETGRGSSFTVYLPAKENGK